ncbi:hypothetical protein ACIBL3_03075 [Kribbella sp. NPDC050124]|uniref:hypothetical protein n=1 Tax=Kribbella sp. NPDC050124 TaxID=3364114 RepID=UPI00379670C3
MTHLLRDSDAMTVYVGCPEDQMPDADYIASRTTGAFVLSRGATLLKDQGSFRTHADPVGHPFCVYAGAVEAPLVERVVFDCYSFPDGAQPAIRRAEDLGAIHMPPNKSTSQCYADPSGHPFCL